ncbi:hypothetical protein [Streptomyces sp. GbtcB7]|nr:hypothetical protein [Streptomyces sp. GbtcB7]
MSAEIRRAAAVIVRNDASARPAINRPSANDATVITASAMPASTSSWCS